MRHTAALVIAKVAAIEIPQNAWPDLINNLLSNMSAAAGNDGLRQATLESLGYVVYCCATVLCGVLLCCAVCYCVVRCATVLCGALMSKVLGLIAKAHNNPIQSHTPSSHTTPTAMYVRNSVP